LAIKTLARAESRTHAKTQYNTR